MPPDPHTPNRSLGCPNCGAAGGSDFCPDCGQDNRRGRLDGRHLLGEFLQNLADLDTSLLRTLRGLVRSPGGLAADYVAGRRARYVSPLRFFLGATALFLLVHRLTGLDLDAGLGMGVSITGGPGDAAGRAEAARGFIASHLDAVVVIALPVIAAFQRLLFRGFDRNYAETLVYLFFVQGQLFLYDIALLSVGFWRQEAVVPARLALHLLMLCTANRAFYGPSWPRSVTLGLLGTAGYLLIMGIVAGLVVALTLFFA
ncbi:DUF3667 domain-containing protein [bacterium]|nr:DUF3667 domain-containing protein [bacterium]